ncbi:rubrerythrin-related protein, fused to C-terminal DUF835 domain [Thermococcus kodakarensis KOD1]|uniref:Rubrerythrin-related protein, fused to C-terminal DUF835 domain n=1 Tax=Thermococcus kodakarensis (strain ATCC BAA-918 / JCM 12380 / KOD1) TaxID=69014 RepID=Q5JG16_THEKO|nr:DUF835 domain-containing protein [Thermococcus kodakarensis]WCN28393.1 DUF835 domain-containing protein [Thermococcus kodakarensis]WCN30689.1 DUF835 domain-containing protein [Thermococcus kodakarensis]BAD84505.1 rubrerythrin-related protein, fused to C-terminal DUF835 domain [Thermococcus kodakarensis KOD1]
MTSHPNPQVIMNEIIERLKRLSPKELLSYAIFNEEDEAKYYAELAEKAKRKSVRALFKKMSRESKGHELLLRRTFERLFPGEEPVKVDVPPVEVYPFYPEFEKVEDYIRALEYCMESELFAKRTYEILAGVAENEDVRGIAFELSQIEQKHYEEIKKVYDIVISFERRHVFIERLGSGAYLVTDDEKAKYILLDMLTENREVIAVIREHPDKFRELTEIDNVIWVSKISEEYPGKVVPPKFVPELKGELLKFLKSAKENGKQGVVFVQNVGYLVVELGFKDAMDFLLYVKDAAMVYNGYIIVSANPDAFEKKEWGLLTSEFEVIL